MALDEFTTTFNLEELKKGWFPHKFNTPENFDHEGEINNNNLFIYSALFNMLGDQKRITTINNLKTIQILEVYKYI